ncbi:hypothetical protein WME79_34865 [Sorangium sp. So ce726]|uniref:hypothetical protein n=1 Tax=Sorangium sp. So ce726 TaxID=3133319 RepID=UPI003F638CD1
MSRPTFQAAHPAPTRRPPYWGFGAQGAAGDPEPRALKSTVLRRKALGDAA